MCGSNDDNSNGGISPHRQNLFASELHEGCLAHVQQPAAIAMPVRVQALATQAQLRVGETPKPNRLKATHQRKTPFSNFIAGDACVFRLLFAGHSDILRGLPHVRCPVLILDRKLKR